MATAIATPVSPTMDECLRTSYKPDVDFVDGDFEERNALESDHARLQTLLSGSLIPLEEQGGFESRIAQRMQVVPSRARIADFALISSAAPFEEVLQTAPLLCLEIMSPEDRLARTSNVLRNYLEMEVANLWLIHPQKQLADTYGPAGLQQQHDLLLRAEVPDGTLDVKALFTRLDGSRRKSQA